MGEEIQEIHEQAHEAQEHPALAPVTISMAIMAVIVAATSLLGHRAHTEELLAQNQASDRWAEFQAKSIRRHGYEQIKDLLGVLDTKGTKELQEKYQSEAERARKDQDEIQEKAKDFEAERDHSRTRADRFDLGEVILEASLVIMSLTLLTRKRVFWGIGGVLAVFGLAFAVWGFLAP